MHGASRHPYDRFNLAAHVGDRPEAVTANRRQLQARLDLPAEPAWLQQQHGNVADVYDSNQCTYANKDLFYSGRRDGITGRMASLVWIDSEKTVDNDIL